jgi:hypothetical protein
MTFNLRQSVKSVPAFSSLTSRPSRDKLLIGIYLSFFDKKELTNGIDWFIPSAMNANEMTPYGKNARLNRIKNVSWIVRYIVLGFLALTIGYWLYFLYTGVSSKFYPYLRQALVAAPLQLILCLWYWTLAKLFQLYGRGSIFSTEAIRRIKTLGILCVVNWLLLAFVHICELISSKPSIVSHVESGIGSNPTWPSGRSSMAFFTFSVEGINVGLLLTGFIIVIIAWIMDEGRKIQEEQELTV